MSVLSLNRMVFAAAMFLTAGMAQAITIDMVPVGNINNAADTRVMAPDGTTGYGSVGYSYDISKCEISAGQYTAFLNAVTPGGPTTDLYGLYNTNMAAGTIGSVITYNSTTHYTAIFPNQPVNYVSWGDAARFCNWLSNGQPTTGVQDATTTEDGSYYLNGKTIDTDLMTITRRANATWVIPNENEWYKAAYYDPNKGGEGVGGYWLYPTKSNDAPGNTYLSTDSNSANYHNTLGVSPYTTEVGSFTNSLSTYGTLDQCGNLSEWVETAIRSGQRGVRGGHFEQLYYYIASSYRIGLWPTYEYRGIVGFRVASVPEPGSILMTAMIALTGLLYFWRKHA